MIGMMFSLSSKRAEPLKGNGDGFKPFGMLNLEMKLFFGMLPQKSIRLYTEEYWKMYMVNYSLEIHSMVHFFPYMTL